MTIKSFITYISFLFMSSLVSITPLHAQEGAKGVVIERMNKFKMSKKMMQTIHKSIQNEDFGTIEKSVTTLYNWSKEMIKFFPAGSDGVPSEASTDIWLDPEGFKKAVNNFELASLKLINDTQEKDFEKTVDSFRSLAGTCKGCHQKFRNYIILKGIGL